MRPKTFNESAQELHDAMMELWRVAVVEPLTHLVEWLNKQVERWMSL